MYGHIPQNESSQVCRLPCGVTSFQSRIVSLSAQVASPFNPLEELNWEATSSLALSLFPGVNVILDFPHHPTYLFIILALATILCSINTQTAPPLEGTLGSATVLYWTTGSNTSLASTSPLSTTIQIGKVYPGVDLVGYDHHQAIQL